MKANAVPIFIERPCLSQCFFYYRGVLSVTDHSPVVGAAVEDCVEGNDGVVPPNLKPPKITKNESPESTLKIYNEQKK